MDLQQAYKNWQDNNIDEHLHMIKKREQKPRTIQLWNRKLKAWKNKQKLGKDMIKKITVDQNA